MVSSNLSALIHYVHATTNSSSLLTTALSKSKKSLYVNNRQQDVRATEIDKVDMHSSFRPGDIVRALVVSLCKTASSIFP
ncbi:hypothetical protein CK203_019671 [Vitis vinifera]|uniref:Exosome complex component CSL4 C-terminal domain-containing protein n=1 Tax=Vitis vinifera TaxID=29760 RepID=A0A438JR21_VITVI|nr:hypothetical protein CK203_019671 [Vitis vinifera]